MSNILLIEPNYKNKYPPIGLMKLATFHKTILHDYVRLAKGQLPEALSKSKWDKVYVTSLFTFEWAETIKSIKYAQSIVDSPDQVIVGGIAATLLPDQIYQETGIHPICGLLNESNKLGLPGDECIDQLVPDYSILDDIVDEYIYPYHDAYFLSSTKGCGMKCGFCAVQKLEPIYIPYSDIKEKIKAIDEFSGPKRDLLLMDNNVLRSSEFDRIIDDIIKAGYPKGATYKNPKTGKSVLRYVDFNQGLDANFLTPQKAHRLGEIALRPARIAFDHIEDRATYDRAVHLCAENGITELSNYILYNSEDFSGKGQSYIADTPENLYDRLRITIDLKDEINLTLSEEKKINIFSFPMRYIPLSALERSYVGSKWNPKFLRAFQCMMIPTQGKGVGSRSFFEADFGKDSTSFIRFLSMPEDLIASRGHFTLGGRGRKDETKNEAVIRKDKWDESQRRLKEWNRLYDLLEDDRNEFTNKISDNEFLPEKIFGLSTETQQKLYLHYLTIPRLFSLLGKLANGSPTRDSIKNYFINEFPCLYQSLIKYIIESDSQRPYIFKNFIDLFGNDGLDKILLALEEINYNAEKQFVTWSKSFPNNEQLPIDFELIRIYRRYIDLDVLNIYYQKSVKNAIKSSDMTTLSSILNRHLSLFSNKVNEKLEDELGKQLLIKTKNYIFNSIQIKLSDIMDE